jgi:hypothetical protein
MTSRSGGLEGPRLPLLQHMHCHAVHAPLPAGSHQVRHQHCWRGQRALRLHFGTGPARGESARAGLSRWTRALAGRAWPFRIAGEPPPRPPGHARSLAVVDLVALTVGGLAGGFAQAGGCRQGGRGISRLHWQGLPAGDSDRNAIATPGPWLGP